MAAKKKVFNIHPGEILREEFMRPLGLTAYQLARELHVSVPRVNDIVRERRAVTADTALRLARYFGGDARTWMNLQIEYDLRIAESKVDLRNVRPRKRTVE